MRTSNKGAPVAARAKRAGAAAPAGAGSRASAELTLAIDIGGTGLKASTVDPDGQLAVPKVRVPTPHPCSPAVMVDALVELVKPLKGYTRISIGFPGVVRNNRILTAPHFGTEEWSGFALADELASRLGSLPVRLINDAEMQGLAAITGRGLELVLTLGTGAGTALFRDGELMPHLELAHHPVHKSKTYNDYVGDAALKEAGAAKWHRRVLRVIGILGELLHYDHLYIGGGNAVKLGASLPEHVTIVSNDAGIEGGAALWNLRTVR